MTLKALHAVRGQILHFTQDPALHGEDAWHYEEDGLLVISEGKVQACGDAKQLLGTLPENTVITHYPHHLIMPGFIDTHVHYPQTQIIGAYGEQLLTWLNNYTFPAESQFADGEHASRVANLFLDELLRNGTTSALVFATMHPQSVDAIFYAAEQRNLRLISGKVLMDRNVPDYIKDTAQSGYDDSKALIEKWHNKARLSYAVTPRFAPTSTEEQLTLAGQLLTEYDDLFVQTHLSENMDEIAWVKRLFPKAHSYLDVYDQFNLLHPRSVLAHGIHLEPQEIDRIVEIGCSISHCPTSNLFLGSGLFDIESLTEKGVQFNIGTDVGAGTSFSMLKTLSESYKIQQLQKSRLDPFRALYLATQGAAKSLQLDAFIGNFERGKEADFVVHDLHATPLLAFRQQYCQTLLDKLFVLIMLGDDRCTTATYTMGECVYSSSNTSATNHTSHANKNNNQPRATEE